MLQKAGRSLGIFLLIACLGGAAQTGDLTKLEGGALEAPPQEDLRNLSLLVRQLMPQELGPVLGMLNSAINRAFKAKDDTATWRLLTRLIVTMQGGRWDEGMEIFSSYRLNLDRRILLPGEPLEVSLSPLFHLSRAPREPFTIRLRLVDARGRAARPDQRIEIKELAKTSHTFSTAGLRDGDYEVVYELLRISGESVAETRRPVTVDRRIDDRLARLARQLGAAPDSADDPRTRAALETAEYLHQTIALARREYAAGLRLRAHPFAAMIRGLDDMGQYAGEPFHLATDLPLAERLVAAAAATRDPFAGLTGHLRLAYRSDVDKTLQPYRVFVPARKATRLLVTLHGVAGDENSYFGPFTAGLLEKLASERGFVIASPNGRGPVGGYVGSSRRDVYDVRDRVVMLFGLDDRQVYLTGHSMGAMGAWQIAFEKPELWAGVAPVAGAMGVSRRLLERAPDMPVLLAQGAQDRLTIPLSARNVAGYAREALTTFDYREYPDADHFTIGTASLPDVFDFFDRVAAQPGGAQ